MYNKAQIGFFLKRLAQRMLRDSDRENMEQRINELTKYWFLADAPLFINSSLIDRLYDAIYRPEFEVTSRTDTSANTKTKEASVEIGGTGDFNVPMFIKAAGSLKTGGKLLGSRTVTGAVTEIPVYSAERLLEEIVTLYLRSYKDRLLWFYTETDDMDENTAQTDSDRSPVTLWRDKEKRVLERPGPRPLVVIDIMPGAKILPMYVEFANGMTKEIHKAFSDPETGGRPKFPAEGSPNIEEAVTKYWEEMLRISNTDISMRAIEEASTEAKSKVSSIDYRLICTPSADIIPIHLHLIADGTNANGDFGYQFIRRSYRYGSRIIGTMKKGRDVNVLAIYEK